VPRVLDVGQCNDAYSAIQIAVAVAGALGVGVNDLPLHYAISWFEQKATAVLLTMLHLGIKRIHLGPTLPQFLTPEVLGVLIDKFDIRPTGDAREDLQRMLLAA
jgi:hydroxylamine reductase